MKEDERRTEGEKRREGVGKRKGVKEGSRSLPSRMRKGSLSH